MNTCVIHISDKVNFILKNARIKEFCIDDYDFYIKVKGRKIFLIKDSIRCEIVPELKQILRDDMIDYDIIEQWCAPGAYNDDRFDNVDFYRGVVIDGQEALIGCYQKNGIRYLTVYRVHRNIFNDNAKLKFIIKTQISPIAIEEIKYIIRLYENIECQ